MNFNIVSSRKSAMRTAALAASILGFSCAFGQYNIYGTNYGVSSPTESFSATFTQPDGGDSTGLYDGYVLLTVSGVGQSEGATYNDAFYQFPSEFHDPSYYQLTFSTTTLVGLDPSQDAFLSVYGGLPAYNDNHEYEFILYTGTATPSSLHFGVSDGIFSDNTGAYNISVNQLTPTPSPAAVIPFVVGLAGLRRRRKG